MFARLRIFSTRRTLTPGYRRLQDCTNEHIEGDVRGVRKAKKSFSNVRDKTSDTDVTSKVASCDRWAVRRNGLCESEIQEDVRTLKRRLFEEAMRSACLF